MLLNYVFICVFIFVLCITLVAYFMNNVSLWILITNIGSEYFIIALVLLIYIFDVNFGLEFVLCISFCIYMIEVLKFLFKFPRPPKYLWKISVSGYSFPSGHAMITSTFWSYLVYKLRNIFCILCAIVIVVSVSMSRIFLGVHYLRDVIFGSIFGLAISTIFYYINNFVVKRLKVFYFIFIILGFVFYFIYGIDIFLKVCGLLIGISISLLLFDNRIMLLNRLRLRFKLLSYVITLFMIILVIYFLKILHPLITYSIAGFLAFTIPLLFAYFCKNFGAGGGI